MQSLAIGSVLLQNNILLAPMAGITDLPFRLLCHELGCGLSYTEMVSAKGLCYHNENTQTLLACSPEQGPVAVQLFGSDPDVLARAVRQIEPLPFAIIDINMGCPAPKIVKNGEGSALMKNPAIMGKIVEAVVKATKKPVTVKIRKGFNSSSVNAVEAAKILQESGASAVTVHGRTREEYYSGTADWEIIGQVKAALTIPVIGNGDVIDPLSAQKMLTETNCDSIMIGRAARGNPWIFSRVNHFLRTGDLLPQPFPAEKANTALNHLRMLTEYKGEYTALLEMRSHLCWYTRGLPGSGEIRAQINKAARYDELVELINRHFSSEISTQK